MTRFDPYAQLLIDVSSRIYAAQCMNWNPSNTYAPSPDPAMDAAEALLEGVERRCKERIRTAGEALRVPDDDETIAELKQAFKDAAASYPPKRNEDDEA